MFPKTHKQGNKNTPKRVARQAPKAYARGGRSRPRGSNIGQTQLTRSAVSAPSTIGIALPNAYFRMDGKAQSLTDIGGMGDSTRVTGCDLFGTAVQAGSSTAAAGFGSTGTYWVPMTPGAISTRLAHLEELFQFYAIRKLRIIYSPEVPTSTAGSLAIGLAQDADVVVISSPTQQQLMELTPAFKMPVWMTGSMEYTHTGTKLWETSLENSESVYNTEQLIMACTLTGGVASTQYGTLWMEYVIDFYKPSMVLGSPTRSIHEQRSLARWKAFTERRQASEFKNSSRGVAIDPPELKKTILSLDEDYQSVSSTPRVPADERKSEREASVERKPVVTGGPRSGLFR